MNEIQIQRDVFNDWKILIVDDDPFGLNIMEILLKHYGATIYTALNGKLGLEAARLHHPDMIISDLSMPEMDGWQMIEALKADRATASIPIVALTAHAMVGDRERAIAAGCHNYLTKPVHAPTFIASLVLIVNDIPELEEKVSKAAS